MNWLSGLCILYTDLVVDGNDQVVGNFTNGEKRVRLHRDRIDTRCRVRWELHLRQVTRKLCRVDSTGLIANSQAKE